MRTNGADDRIAIQIKDDRNALEMKDEREIKDTQEHKSYGRYRCLGEQTKTICHLSFYTKSLARMFLK